MSSNSFAGFSLNDDVADITPAADRHRVECRSLASLPTDHEIAGAYLSPFAKEGQRPGLIFPRRHFNRHHALHCMDAVRQFALVQERQLADFVVRHVGICSVAAQSGIVRHQYLAFRKAFSEAIERFEA